jgi:hypothetical protein
MAGVRHLGALNKVSYVSCARACKKFSIPMFTLITGVLEYTCTILVRWHNMRTL